MRAVVLRKPGEFSCEDIPRPVIGPGEILVKMEKAAICGTDMRILDGTKTKNVHYPSVIGHEFAGTIEEIAPDVSGYRLGQRVAICPIMPCGRCRNCLNGRENICMTKHAIGYETNGGFEEYVAIPAHAVRNGNVLPLPDNISFEEGALIEPLSCVVNGEKRNNISVNDLVVIIGGGAIGLMHLQTAKAMGAGCVVVSEPNAARRAVALELGADYVVDPVSEDLEELVRGLSGGIGADIVVLAFGSAPLVNTAIRLCRKGGTVNLFGGFPGVGEATVNANLIHYGELTVTGTSGKKRQDYIDAANLIFSGKVNVRRLATHTYKLEQFAEAYEKFKSGEGLKIIVEP